jgi:probable HAF family extracellular repeat protein
MKNRMSTVCYLAITLLGALALPVRLAAQDPPAADGYRHHLRYRFVDLGTFGGHHSEVDGGSVVINRRGTVVGGAETADACPHFPQNPISPGFKWENGVMTELPRLPGGCSGFPIAINEHGLIVGVADNGLIDPFTGAPEIHAVVWQDERIIDLGTFGGPNSLAGAVNERGQVTGVAQTAASDPFHFGDIIGLPNSTQWRGFLWQDGVMHDLGTLGGPDAAVSGFLALNDRSQILGISLTNDIVNPVTGFPTLDSFLWSRGQKLDLGTLGGTFTNGLTINNAGQIVGSSNLPGDTISHPFVWNRGLLTDLGTLGGDNGSALWNNDAGDVVGTADVTGNQIHHGFLWKHGIMEDLGTFGDDPCSNAVIINASAQVIGTSTDCHGVRLHIFLSENGGPMIDLNAFVPTDSGVRIEDPRFINAGGLIAAQGILQNGDEHAVVLIPCGGDTDPGCREASQDVRIVAKPRVPAHVAASANQPKSTPMEMVLNHRLGWSHPLHITNFTAPSQ